MKRIIAAFTAVMLFVCIQVTALAESRNIGNTGQTISIDVKAVYVPSNEPGLYEGKVTEGSSSVTTENGITIEVSGDESQFESGVKLIVKEVTEDEAEAYGWFSDVLKEVGTNILPLDIYFEKAGQKVQINSKVRVTITLPDGYTNPIICYVSPDGTVEIIDSTVEDGKIIFEVDHFSYYVLADKKETGDTTNTPQPTDTTKAGETTGTTGTTKAGNQPKTGENTSMIFYLLAVAAFGLIYITFAKKRRFE